MKSEKWYIFTCLTQKEFVVYTIGTAKMSSKGQVVVPDALRKRYGWRSGTTLLMLGASEGVLLQSLPVPDDQEVERTLAASRTVASTIKVRMRNAKRSLDRLSSLAISLPLDVERGESRRALVERRHA
jgi:bifunctional DNA-binding transcriptional regulator/antitoxin component of YhaV-PrlF toxin-antitoxin module